jgi:hypothetical protein
MSEQRDLAVREYKRLASQAQGDLYDAGFEAGVQSVLAYVHDNEKLHAVVAEVVGVGLSGSVHAACCLIVMDVMKRLGFGPPPSET